ncbi:MAG: hypothetical protein N2Z22_07295 [Turneriella sp.]|nr:hypothetical protein [Turneriella sp.]
MKKMTIFSLGLLVVAIGCSDKATAERAYANLFATTAAEIRQCSEKIKAAKSGKEVAAALNKFWDAMENMKKRAEELQKKYNLTIEPDKAPQSIRKEAQDFEQAFSNFIQQDMMAIVNYAADPEVSKAMARIQKLASGEP